MFLIGFACGLLCASVIIVVLACAINSGKLSSLEEKINKEK